MNYTLQIFDMSNKRKLIAEYHDSEIVLNNLVNCMLDRYFYHIPIRHMYREYTSPVTLLHEKVNKFSYKETRTMWVFDIFYDEYNNPTDVVRHIRRRKK